MTSLETAVAAEATSPKRANPHSRPIFRRELQLSSSQAQRVMDRSFIPTAHALFSIDVILRIISEQDQVDEVENVVLGIIDKVSDDMTSAQAQFEKLMEDNGIDVNSLPEYDSPRSFPVEITSPQIAHFVGLVVRLDKLMAYIDTLWLNSILNNKQRSDATYQWQQRLIRLAGRIIGMEKRARISAHSKGKSQEVAELAPEVQTADAEILAEANAEHSDSDMTGDKPTKRTKKAA